MPTADVNWKKGSDARNTLGLEGADKDDVGTGTSDGNSFSKDVMDANKFVNEPPSDKETSELSSPFLPRHYTKLQ